MIQKILREAQFNPKSPGTMRMIAGMEDPSYYEKRAIELIHESGADRLTALSCELAKSDDKAQHYRNGYHQKMNKAIQLLALARIIES